jgi:hypothetical protein
MAAPNSSRFARSADAENRPLAFVVIGASVVLFAYWAIYALLAPVTVWDSQVYNLAELMIARHGGFFGNPDWNSVRQILFPWAFDAVHYPFLALGRWGVALPSFACFVGIAIVVFRVARASLGPSAAWWCVLTLFSLPTLMYQASSTKNDLAVIFGVACWYYAYWRWRREPARGWIWWMAVALGFAAGAKSSGVPLALLLGGFSAWRLARSQPVALEFIGALLVAGLVCGSAETYLNNRRVHGHWLGPPALVDDHRNRDGLRGAAANFVRYAIGNQNFDLDVRPGTSRSRPALEQMVRSFLPAAGLANVGYRSDFNDDSLVFPKFNAEAAADFGPVGGLSLLAAILFLFTRPKRSAVVRLSALGLASLAFTSATIAWMPWNARFLMLPFILCSLALTLQMLAWSKGRWLPSALWLGLLLFSAFAYPIYSKNKKPSDIVAAVKDRRTLETLERPTMKEVIDEVELVGANAVHPPTVLLLAGTDSWILPLLQLRSLRWVPKPRLAPDDLIAAGADGSSYVLVLDHQVDPALLPHLELLRTFEEPFNFLYRIRREPLANPPTVP